MVELISNGVFLYHGTDIVPADSSAALDQQEVFNKERAYKETNGVPYFNGPPAT